MLGSIAILKFLYHLLWQLSASGDSGMPEVVADPLGEVANTFQDLGVCVVQQCAKIRQQGMYLLSTYSLMNLLKHKLVR